MLHELPSNISVLPQRTGKGETRIKNAESVLEEFQVAETTQDSTFSFKIMISDAAQNVENIDEHCFLLTFKSQRHEDERETILFKSSNG